MLICNSIFKSTTLRLKFFIAFKDKHPNTWIQFTAFFDFKSWFVKHTKKWSTCCCHYHIKLMERCIDLNNMHSKSGGVHGHCPCKCIDICHSRRGVVFCPSNLIFTTIWLVQFYFMWKTRWKGLAQKSLLNGWLYFMWNWDFESVPYWRNRKYQDCPMAMIC